MFLHILFYGNSGNRSPNDFSPQRRRSHNLHTNTTSQRFCYERERLSQRRAADSLAGSACMRSSRRARGAFGNLVRRYLDFCAHHILLCWLGQADGLAGVDAHRAFRDRLGTSPTRWARVLAGQCAARTQGSTARRCERGGPGPCRHPARTHGACFCKANSQHSADENIGEILSDQ